MKAETLKEYAEKYGWEFSYSRVTQDWNMKKLPDGPMFLMDPTFEDVNDLIEACKGIKKGV